MKFRFGGIAQRFGVLMGTLLRRSHQDMDRCIRCIFDEDDHPWHDNGTSNTRYIHDDVPTYLD
jgi:hypothetical protein